MTYNDFSVRVVGGKEISGGYVEIEHGKEYQIRLRNYRSVRCDARVLIDGQHIGTWRIEPNTSILVERPVDVAKKLTFYKGSSKEAIDNLEINDIPEDKRGLLQVEFTPELVSYVPLTWTYYTTPWSTTGWTISCSSDNAGATYRGMPSDSSATLRCCTDSLTTSATTLASSTFASSNASITAHEAGVTGLGNTSSQKFGTAGYINYDVSQQTVISLRLVAPKNEPVQPVKLVSRGNPVPPPIRP